MNVIVFVFTIVSKLEAKGVVILKRQQVKKSPRCPDRVRDKNTTPILYLYAHHSINHDNNTLVFNMKMVDHKKKKKRPVARDGSSDDDDGAGDAALARALAARGEWWAVQRKCRLGRDMWFKHGERGRRGTYRRLPCTAMQRVRDRRRRCDRCRRRRRRRQSATADIPPTHPRTPVITKTNGNTHTRRRQARPS